MPLWRPVVRHAEMDLQSIFFDPVRPGFAAQMGIQFHLTQRFSIHIYHTAAQEEGRQIGFPLGPAVMQPGFIMQRVDQAKGIVAVEDLGIKSVFPDDRLFPCVHFIFVSSEIQPVLGTGGEAFSNFRCFDHDITIARGFKTDHAFRALAAMLYTDTFPVFPGVDQDTCAGYCLGRCPVDASIWRTRRTVPGLITSVFPRNMQLAVINLFFFPKMETLSARQKGGWVNRVIHKYCSFPRRSLAIS